jgi:hypothetical protein
MISNHTFSILHAERSLFTGPDTGPATNTFRNSIEFLYHRQLAFRVVTPSAAKGTSLEKDCYPDPRTIIDRVAFDVKDESRMFHGLWYFLGFFTAKTQRKSKDAKIS